MDIKERMAEGERRGNETQLRFFVEQVPAPIAMLDREMRYLAASRRWVSEFCPDSAAVVGRSFYEVMPGISEHWKAIHQRALAGATVKEEEDLWRPPGGRERLLRWDICPWHRQDGEIGGVLLFAEDVSGKIQALHESEERFRIALQAGHMGMWEWDIQSGQVQWNDECERMLGYKDGEVEPTYAAWANRIHPDDRESAETMVSRALSERKDYRDEYRVVLPDGTIRWLSDYGRCIYDPDGQALRMIGLMQDISEKREAQEAQGVLVAELQHRTQNLIAVVQSIAQQTLNTATTLEDFGSRFSQRLEALSRVQTLLTQTDGESLNLAALIDLELKALGDDVLRNKVSVSGPMVPLRRTGIQTFALAIHELATNARKHGAFATEAGHLAVTWRIEGTPANERLILDWVETEINATLTKPDNGQPGYGRALIERGLPYSLSAKTKYDLSRDTLRCSISLPLARIGETGA